MSDGPRTSEEAWTGREGVPELALWRSVIDMALRDACGRTLYLTRRSGVARFHVHQARAWFEGGGLDFRIVCSLAGLEPEAVRHGALRKIREAENGTRTRD